MHCPYFLSLLFGQEIEQFYFSFYHGRDFLGFGSHDFCSSRTNLRLIDRPGVNLSIKLHVGDLVVCLGLDFDLLILKPQVHDLGDLVRRQPQFLLQSQYMGERATSVPMAFRIAMPAPMPRFSMTV